jgi:hypothetical protein
MSSPALETTTMAVSDSQNGHDVVRADCTVTIKAAEG